nr:DUF433 domain-containing protein [Oscillatoria sp. PCC 10802]
MDIGTLITRDTQLRGGRPIIAGTGTSVRRIAVLYKQGLHAEEIVSEMGPRWHRFTQRWLTATPTAMRLKQIWRRKRQNICG